MQSFRLKNLFAVLAFLCFLFLALAGWLWISGRPGSAKPAAAALRSGAKSSGPPKPYFRLSTNRSYGTAEKPVLWASYRDIDHLDFRVYRVKDPARFFMQLSNPHQMGEKEKEWLPSARKPSLLEQVRSVKKTVLNEMKSYFRGQLSREARITFNRTFREEKARQPLNVADYARISLLNQDQLISSWREALPRLEGEYDSRRIGLGKKEPGVYLVEAVNEGLRAYTIAIVTDLTLVYKTSPRGEVLVYSVDRGTGKPFGNVAVELTRGEQRLASGKTAPDGIYRCSIPVPPGEGNQAAGEGDEGPDPSVRADLVMGRWKEHFTLSDLPAYFFASGEGNLSGYIYSERPVYRPGQKVYFKGILRRLGDSGYSVPRASTIHVTVEDSNRARILEKDLPFSVRGTFHGEVEIPTEAALGDYQIEASLPEGKSSGYFSVEEYKKPELKVSVTTPEKFVPAGASVSFEVEGRYFFGEPVASAEVKYYLYRSPYYAWRWGEGEDDDEGDSGEDDYGYGKDMIQDGAASLDKEGKCRLSFQIPGAGEENWHDYRYQLEVQVTDASRRSVEGKAFVVATRGSVLAEVRPDRYVYAPGEKARLQLRTFDYGGKPVSSRLILQFFEEKWEKKERQGEYGKYFEWLSRKRELSSELVATDANGQAEYQYTCPGAGSLLVQATVEEGTRKYKVDQAYLWINDRNREWADWGYRDYGSIQMVPDKKSYTPGETAHILVLLPSAENHLLISTELNGILSVRTMFAPGRTVMLDVPIDSRYVPNVFLTVNFCREGRLSSDMKMLRVPARDKFLKLEIAADKNEYLPREEGRYSLVARNPDGSAAAGVELSVGVVDEAIYSVRPERGADIRRAFYGVRYNRVQTNFTSYYYFSGHSGEQPLELSRQRKANQLADFKNESQYAPPLIRKDFRDTAFWLPEVVTGPDGKATFSLKFPDNLTSWRATARGVTADTRVGSGLGNVVVRKNLILRLEIPRFVREGDALTVSGIVHNYLAQDKQVQLSLEVDGAQLSGPPERSLFLPQHGEQRVDWNIKAGGAGQMTLLAKALTDAESDGVELPVPVLPNGVAQTDARSWVFSGDQVEETLNLNLPAEAHPTARGFRLEAAPSLVASLFGALDYLTSYPYGCVEQTMSSFLPNVVVSQTLKDVATASIQSPQQLLRKVQKGMNRLYGFQHDDGGWGWWTDDQSDPFMTAYVVDGLLQARDAGYKVEEYRLEQGRNWLRKTLETSWEDKSQSIDLETRAYLNYACVASGSAGQSVSPLLFERRQELKPFGVSLLGLTLLLEKDESRARQAADELEASARVNENEAYWVSVRKPRLDFSEQNDLEATSLALKVLCRVKPQSPLLPKVARWLMANRRLGSAWDSTKQTAFAILGLDEYLKITGELNSSFQLQVLLNGEPVHSGTFAGPAGLRAPFVLERKGASVPGNLQVKLVKKGKGPLYVSSALAYFAGGESVPAQSSPELSVRREYFRLLISREGDRPAWKMQPLTGEIRAGDLIVSRLTLQGARAQYLMLEDPIPAGCEQVESAGGLNLGHATRNWCDWYSQREFRDDRTVFFLSDFYGKAALQYVLRVIVPGGFHVGPPRAELMYRPAVHAHDASQTIQFSDRP